MAPDVVCVPASRASTLCERVPRVEPCGWTRLCPCLLSLCTLRVGPSRGTAASPVGNVSVAPACLCCTLVHVAVASSVSRHPFLLRALVADLRLACRFRLCAAAAGPCSSRSSLPRVSPGLPCGRLGRDSVPILWMFGSRRPDRKSKLTRLTMAKQFDFRTEIRVGLPAYERRVLLLEISSWGFLRESQTDFHALYVLRVECHDWVVCGAIF